MKTYIHINNIIIIKHGSPIGPHRSFSFIFRYRIIVSGNNFIYLRFLFNLKQFRLFEVGHSLNFFRLIFKPFKSRVVANIQSSV